MSPGSPSMTKGLVLSVLSAVCFGFLPVFGKLGYAAGLDLGGMLFCRFFFAALFVGLYFLVSGRVAGLRRLRVPWKTLWRTALIGGLIYPLQSLCFFAAVAYIPASTTTLVYYGYPLTVTLLFWAVGGQRPGRNVWISLSLIGAGICLVFFNAFLQHTEPLGLLLAAGSMTVFSFYLLLVQRFLTGRDPLVFTFWVLTFAACTFAIGGLPSSGLFHAPLEAWLVGLGLGLVPTALAVTLLYRAVSHIGSPYVSLFSTLEPGVTVLVSWVILGEPLLPLKLGGLALIVAGIVLPNLKMIRASRLSTKPPAHRVA